MRLRTEKQVLDGLSINAHAYQRMDVVSSLGQENSDLSREFVEQTLVRVLKEDPNSIVRHEAAFGLGSIHCDGKELRPASIDALCEAAQWDASIVVRHEAAEALGCVFTSKVWEVLQLLVRDPDADADLVETAFISLGRHEQARRV